MKVKTIEPAEVAYILEVSAEEMKILFAAIGSTSNNKCWALLEEKGIKHSHCGGQGIYEQLKQHVMGE